ncbi:hypothetical protein QFZ58_000335 [Streptomyces sp. B1I3]|nr:hypothetical protein [Streptomyces sp. B1I3]
MFIRYAWAYRRSFRDTRPSPPGPVINPGLTRLHALITLEDPRQGRRIFARLLASTRSAATGHTRPVNMPAGRLRKYSATRCPYSAGRTWYAPRTFGKTSGVRPRTPVTPKDHTEPPCAGCAPPSPVDPATPPDPHMAEPSRAIADRSDMVGRDRFAHRRAGCRPRSDVYGRRPTTSRPEFCRTRNHGPSGVGTGAQASSVSVRRDSSRTREGGRSRPSRRSRRSWVGGSLGLYGRHTRDAACSLASRVDERLFTDVCTGGASEGGKDEASAVQIPPHAVRDDSFERGVGPPAPAPDGPRPQRSRRPGSRGRARSAPDATRRVTGQGRGGVAYPVPRPPTTSGRVPDPP